MSNLPQEPNLSFRVSHFNNILISAATTHVGKCKPSKRSKPWMNPHVSAKIHIRNRLLKTIPQNRQQWIDACYEANKSINKAKKESWKNLLQDAMFNSDGPNIWKFIESLNGTPDANSPMFHNGRTITDIKFKASSLTTIAGSANSICHNPTVTPTDSSRSVSTHHLFMMRAVIHF